MALPPGTWHEDEFYGKSEIYRQRLTVPVTLSQAEKGATLTVTYQGCADAGFCYPPETKVVPLRTVLAVSGSESVPAPRRSPRPDNPNLIRRCRLKSVLSWQQNEPPAPQSPRQARRRR
jgi:thiol:disulfide interchange protein DsbD